MRISLLILLVLSSLVAEARDYHYGAVTSAAVIKCDQLSWSGELATAKQCYQSLAKQSTDPAERAEAYWSLGDAKNANQFFKLANEQQPDNSMILSRWGDLYHSTHQLAEAQKLYTEAATLDASNDWAKLGSASVLNESYDPAGAALLGELLEQDILAQGIRFKTLLLSAFNAAEDSDAALAKELLDQAESLALESKLPLPEYYSIRAGLAVRNNESPQDFIDQALAINPAYGDAYAIPAHFYMITFRYDETGEYYQKAVDVQPDNWLAQLELAANHLRQNRGKLARKHFEIAFSGDPYNPAAVNSNRMIDTYDTFELINFPINSEGSLLPKVTMRLDPTEADVLAPYAGELALQAINTLSKRYQHQLTNTATIEMYPNHEDFIVRTLGMPGMGLLGVAFGDVIAMDSPTAQAGNDYHWGTTLWHEVAHIFTLKASGHKIPRWFTEGISVYEEWRSGPLPGIRIPASVWESLRVHEFLPIAELDSGFVRPKYDNQVIVSYMQGGLICEYIETHYGFEKLLNILQAYKEGLDTAAAIERVFEIPTTEFDLAFDKFYQEKFAQIPAQLPAFREQLKTAAMQAASESWEPAIQSANQAITLFPGYVEQDSPYLIKASAYQALEKTDDATQALDNFWQQGGYYPPALKDLTKRLLVAKEDKKAIEVLRSLLLVDPFDLDTHETLGDLLLDDGQAEQALREYEIALLLKPLDRAAAFYRLANANHQLGNQESARQQVLSALDIAPHYRPAQKLLQSLLRSTIKKQE